MRLESQIQEEKNLNESLESYTSTISHEFRTPIGTSLMFLESLLLTGDLNRDSREIIRLVIVKLNLLLSLVQDILDIKLIEGGQFRSSSQTFCPLKELNFIVNMFKLQAEMAQTTIKFRTLRAADLKNEELNFVDFQCC